MQLTEILVPISMFAAIFGILYIFFTTRSKERLALIEKGADSKIFLSQGKAKAKRWILKIGMLAFGIGLGLSIYTFMDFIFQFEEETKQSLIPGIMLIFGGLAGILNYKYEQKLDLEEKKVEISDL